MCGRIAIEMNSALVMLHGRVGCHPLLVYWNVLASDTLLFAALTLRSAARTLGSGVSASTARGSYIPDKYLHLSATAFSASNRGALAPHHRREEVWVGTTTTTTTTLATSG